MLRNLTSAQAVALGFQLRGKAAQRVQHLTGRKPDGQTTAVLVDTKTDRALEKDDPSALDRAVFALAVVVLDLIANPPNTPAEKAAAAKCVTDALERL